MYNSSTVLVQFKQDVLRASSPAKTRVLNFLHGRCYFSSQSRYVTLFNGSDLFRFSLVFVSERNCEGLFFFFKKCEETMQGSKRVRKLIPL